MSQILPGPVVKQCGILGACDQRRSCEGGQGEGLEEVSGRRYGGGVGAEYTRALNAEVLEEKHLG